jgi:hypothetical protein
MFRDLGLLSPKQNVTVTFSHHTFSSLVLSHHTQHRNSVCGSLSQISRSSSSLTFSPVLVTHQKRITFHHCRYCASFFTTFRTGRSSINARHGRNPNKQRGRGRSSSSKPIIGAAAAIVTNCCRRRHGRHFDGDIRHETTAAGMDGDARILDG